MKKNWLWDTRLSENRVKKILKDEKNPRFYIYAEKLFSRITDPKAAFDYVSKEVFCRQWPAIKQRVEMDAWSRGNADFWESFYKKMSKKWCPNGAHLGVDPSGWTAIK